MPLLGNNSGILSLGILTTRLRKSGIRWLQLTSAEVVAQNARIHQKFFQNRFTLSCQCKKWQQKKTKHLIPTQRARASDSDPATCDTSTWQDRKRCGTNQVKSAEGFFSNDSKKFSNIFEHVVCCLPVFFRFLFHAFFSCPCAVLNPRLLVEKSFSQFAKLHLGLVVGLLCRHGRQSAQILTHPEME